MVAGKWDGGCASKCMARWVGAGHVCTRSIAIHACVHARHAYLERADLEFERALVQHFLCGGTPPLRLKSAIHDGRDGDARG